MHRMIKENIKKELNNYLKSILNSNAKIKKIYPLQKQTIKKEKLKDFNYGKSLLIETNIEGKRKEYILATMEKNRFGHEFFYDRAKSLLFDYSSFNKLPKHVKALDIGVYTDKNLFKSIGDAIEFYILREKAEGKEYIKDLLAIQETGSISELDWDRLKVLVQYLVSIHQKKNDKGYLYTRRIRELIGHGECIMGLTDSYPEKLKYVGYDDLEKIEKNCIEWRYKLKKKNNRLSQIHGDFHPWNILFRKGLDFSVLDRSRGEWGEPADDVASITINYLFLSLLNKNKTAELFLKMFDTFWDLYLKDTNDSEILSVIAPFYVWRALVLASPIWYPDIQLKIREKLFRFIENVLTDDKFNYKSIKEYFI
ncbi:MAG: aminoglycoside phosphotransferase family protein [Promethearchaeota archaeon]|nr:MAG: aminoglycoside phosphotransferase family protein [Candidatus Lokiarchaeota archaeon]